LIPRICVITFLVVFLLNAGACSSLHYYAQSISGQMALLSKRQPIEDVINNPGRQDSTKRKLQKIIAIREFATRYLSLPNNNSYRTYADIGRDYVVWNVFATPEFSLVPEEWCFLFVGCLSYRGYFSEEDAQHFAGQLEQRGMDTFVGGVTAYSTLGWFDDPVLNTMLKWDIPRLARVIFHELAHQVIYIKGDTGFNEAFADTVAQVSVRRWLDATGEDDLASAFEQELRQENQFVDLVLRYRVKLENLYSSEPDTASKRHTKNRLYMQMKVEYQELSKSWKDDYGYNRWFETGLNNARLSAVVTYRQYVPGFLALLAVVGTDMKKFYEVVASLGKCELSLRHRVLVEQLTRFEC